MVELIPKEERKIFSAKDILFYFSIFLLIGAFLIYFILINFQQNSSDVLDALEQELIRRTTPKERALEKEVLGYKNKIDDFSSIFSKRNRAVAFFSKMEELTHPKVWFSSLELDLVNLTAAFVGESDSFLTLNQQISALRGKEGISETKLSEIKIKKDGAISFNLDITFDPEFIK